MSSLKPQDPKMWDRGLYTPGSATPNLGPGTPRPTTQDVGPSTPGPIT